MFEYEVSYPQGEEEEEAEMWPARKKYKFVGVGKRPLKSRHSEKYLLAENRVMREFAVMRKCLPSFVTIQFPSESRDLRRFDVVINLVGEIISNDNYGGLIYRFEFRIPEEYPISPPLVECVTPVFHPNIGIEGGVGLKMLRAGSGVCGWAPTDTIEGIIFKLYRVFFHPCNEDTFIINQDAAYIYGRDPTEFKSVVRRVAIATLFDAKRKWNPPARKNYSSDPESLCSSTSSSHSAD